MSSEANAVSSKRPHPAESSRPGSEKPPAAGHGEGLPTPAELADLCRPSVPRTLIAISIQAALICLAVAAAEFIDEPWAIALAVLFIGTRQYGLGEVLVHEASHRNLAQSRTLNDALGTALSWPFFFTFRGYLRFHLQHHLLPLDDPRNSIFEQYQDWRLPMTGDSLPGHRLFWLLVMRPLLGITAVYHLIGIISDAYYDSDLMENTYMWIFWAAVVAVLWQIGALHLLAIYWLLPLLTVFSCLNYWSEISDHYRSSGLLTRSYLGRGWNTLIGGNIGYHVVHHEYPSIPWFRLSRAQARFGGSLRGQVSSGPLAAFAQMRRGYLHVRSSS